MSTLRRLDRSGKPGGAMEALGLVGRGSSDRTFVYLDGRDLITPEGKMRGRQDVREWEMPSKPVSIGIAKVWRALYEQCYDPR